MRYVTAITLAGPHSSEFPRSMTDRLPRDGVEEMKAIRIRP